MGVTRGPAVAVAVAVGVDDGVTDGSDGVGEAVAVAVAVGLRVAVGVGVGVNVAVAVGVAVTVTVGVGVAVAVAVGVGVDVGVGVTEGPCTSKEPLSMRPFTIRSNPGPRWSKKGGGVKFGSPASIARLPGNSAWVNVGPPLFCSGPNNGSSPAGRFASGS